jgi:hypothetical protein
MMNPRIVNQIEPQDIEEFIMTCELRAKELGVPVDYYVEEYILPDKHDQSRES